MSKNSFITTTDATVNFWQGCNKVSDGCKYCYMYRQKEQYGQNGYIIKRSSDATFYSALKWKEPKLIFTCSWSDFFIKEADEWRDEAWKVIKQTPWHLWKIATKRPERILECLPTDWGDGYENVIMGTTAENQKTANIRLPILNSIPAKYRWVICEPLLEQIDTSKYLHNIDWIVIGGESGNEIGKWLYRPCNIEWIEDIVKQCKDANVAVNVKQLGNFLAKKLKLIDRHGKNTSEFPTQLKVQEFPKFIIDKIKL